jgi:hypothetical protein
MILQEGCASAAQMVVQQPVEKAAHSKTQKVWLMGVSKEAHLGDLKEVQTVVHSEALEQEVHALEVHGREVPEMVVHETNHRHSHPLHRGYLGQPWLCKVWACL